MTAVHHWNPADYARNSQGQERWASELIELIALRPEESVLDVGCGDGRITARLAELASAGRVVGIDRSAEMIAFARENFPTGKFSNLSFLQADAGALPFHEEFDVVFSTAALHWVLDHRPVLAGIARSLRPGGRCVLQMGGKGNGAGVTRAVGRCLADPAWQASHPTQPAYGFYAPEQYRLWIEEAGLLPDEIELIEKDMVHSSVEAFTGWLRTAWLPYTERVVAERRDQFLQAATAQYLEEFPPDAAGQVHVEMMRLQVLARRPGAS